MTDILRAYVIRHGDTHTRLLTLAVTSKGGYVLRAGKTETCHTDRRAANADYDAAFAAAVEQRKAAREGFALVG